MSRESGKGTSVLRLVFGIVMGAALIVIGTAVSLTGLAAFFGMFLVLAGLSLMVGTASVRRAGPNARRPWCHTRECDEGPGPELCSECGHTVVIGPDRE